MMGVEATSTCDLVSRSIFRLAGGGAKRSLIRSAIVPIADSDVSPARGSVVPAESDVVVGEDLIAT